MLGRIAKGSATLLLLLAFYFSSVSAAEPLHYELGFEHPSTHLIWNVTSTPQGLKEPLRTLRCLIGRPVPTTFRTTR